MYSKMLHGWNDDESYHCLTGLSRGLVVAAEMMLRLEYVRQGDESTM